MSIAATTRGIAVHWNGPAMGLTSCTGGSCTARVAGIRRFHVQNRGWRDIAYNHLVCPGCGRIHLGRGWGARSAANGTTAGNRDWHAAMVMSGTGEPFTDRAKAGLLELAAEHRRRYGATRLTTHHAVRGGTTACPGDVIIGWIVAGALSPSTVQPTPAPAPAPAVLEDDMLVRIDDSPTVYHVVGPALVPLTSAVQAEVLAGTGWRDKVKQLTPNQLRAFYVAQGRAGARGGPVETADRIQQGLSETGSTPLGLGRWSGPVVRWVRAQGADLAAYEQP